MESEECSSSQQGMKKEQKRLRKKKLLKQLTEQMEFYFSSANLSKDKFMDDLLYDDPFIDVEIFFKFNKIRTLTEDIDLLRKAIKKSSLIQLSEDETKVSRKIPIQEKIDELECTIYIEKLPLHVTHEWVRNLFSQYGSIDYVSIPRYKHSGRPKGFAFLEFQTPEMAKVALEAFGVKDDIIIANVDPADLQSIKTFEGFDENDRMSAVSEIDTISISEETLEKNKKIDTGIEETSSKEENQGKRKMCEKENEAKHTVSEGKDFESDEPSSKKVKKIEETALNKNELPDNESEVIKKKKKKRKKAKVKEQECESISLRVMSKKQWKVLRNKYLNLQRKNMQLLKNNIRNNRYYQDQSDWNPQYQDQSEYNPHYQDQSDWNPHDVNKHSDNYEKVQSDNLVKDSAATKSNQAFCTKPVFIPDVVLKISFEEPPPDPRKLRETIREGGGENVAYVDVSSRESDIYVRFKSKNSASSYLNGGFWSRMEILKGEEEKKYWDHIIKNWEERRAKRNKKDGCGGHGGMSKNIRGKDKIVQKAFQVAQKAKPNSHVVFKD
ncbi:unnamed protein product [Meganyctiphanes norvegica]|uniref:La-related protein 7 n=1 Tax=Meganyctiphanes norvegica TaxID=48144 RepID=A0AAV2RS82_MEGNR